MKNSKNVFDKEASLKLKGAAIIMMITHHCFRTADRFIGYSVILTPLSEQQLINVAEACKICVSIFAFITGYGLYLNYQNNHNSAQSWVAKRYIKTFSGYWIVWTLCMIITQLRYGRVREMLFLDGRSMGIMYMAISFLGLNNLFTTPSIDYRWWYMGAAFLFIFLTPIVYKYKDNLWMVIIAIILLLRIIISYDGSIVAISSESAYAFLIPFVIGGMFARYNSIEKWVSIGEGKLLLKSCKFVAEAWMIMFLYRAYISIPRYLFWEFQYGVFPIVVLMFFIEFILPIGIIGTLLKMVGKHSMNIFLVHSLIQTYYPECIYGNKHFAVSILILLGLSLVISILIEYLKKLIKYDKLIDYLQKRVSIIVN